MGAISYSSSAMILFIGIFIDMLSIRRGQPPARMMIFTQRPRGGAPPARRILLSPRYIRRRRPTMMALMRLPGRLGIAIQKWATVPIYDGNLRCTVDAFADISLAAMPK